MVCDYGPMHILGFLSLFGTPINYATFFSIESSAEFLYECQSSRWGSHGFLLRSEKCVILGLADTACILIILIIDTEYVYKSFNIKDWYGICYKSVFFADNAYLKWDSKILNIECIICIGVLFLGKFNWCCNLRNTMAKYSCNYFYIV